MGYTGDSYFDDGLLPIAYIFFTVGGDWQFRAHQTLKCRLRWQQMLARLV